MSELIRQIKLIRHTQIISDPFLNEEEDISIHEAYMTGYERAYYEIEYGLSNNQELNDIISKGMKDAYDELINSMKLGLEKVNDNTN